MRGADASKCRTFVLESRVRLPAFRSFRRGWQSQYPSMLPQLERDLPELLSFFALPQHLWRKLRTTNIIERCFVEVCRRTQPMACFVNVESVDRIIYSIFRRFNLERKTRTLELFTQEAIHRRATAREASTSGPTALIRGPLPLKLSYSEQTLSPS